MKKINILNKKKGLPSTTFAAQSSCGKTNFVVNGSETDRSPKHESVAGFTLIEMIVAIAVFLLISGVAVGIFLSIINRQKSVLSEQELLNQISYAEEYISRALRMAKASTSNTDNSCLNLGDIYVLTSPETTPGLGQSGFYKGIRFLNQSDRDVDGNAICEEFSLGTTEAGHSVLMIKKGQDLDVALPIALTSPDMKINYVKFGVNGSIGSSTDCPKQVDSECIAATNQDEVQPRVTILLGIFMPGDGGGSGALCTANSDCQTVGEGCDNGKCRPIKIFQTTVSQRNLNVNVGAQP